MHVHAGPADSSRDSASLYANTSLSKNHNEGSGGDALVPISQLSTHPSNAHEHEHEHAGPAGLSSDSASLYTNTSSLKNRNEGSGGDAIAQISIHPFNAHEHAEPADLSSDSASLPSPFKKSKIYDSSNLTLETAHKDRKHRGHATHRGPHRHSSNLASETSSRAHRHERHHGHSHGRRQTPSKDIKSRHSRARGTDSRVEKPLQDINMSRPPPLSNLVDKLLDNMRGGIEYVQGV